MKNDSEDTKRKTISISDLPKGSIIVDEVTADKHNRTLLVFSGILGISVLAVIQFLQLNELDQYLTISLYCFAFAIPLLTMFVFQLRATAHLKFMIRRSHFALLGNLSITTGFLGLICIFLHFSKSAGAIFFLSSIAAVIIGGRFHRKNEEVNKISASVIELTLEEIRSDPPPKA